MTAHQLDSSEPQSQQLDSSTAQEHEEQDPRPVWDEEERGPWASASAQERGRHGAAVQAWKRRHPEATEGDQSAGHDRDVAAILGSGAGKAVLDPVGLRVLREVATDKSAPASARASAANALRAAEEEEQRIAVDVERDRVTAALAAAPLPQRLLLLERIVRRAEPAGWVSVFAQEQEGADPAAPAGAPS